MIRRWLSLGLVLLAALFAPSAAAAATVVNGNFESGNLNGWSVYRATQAGNWFAYQGTTAPIGGKRNAAPVQPPPQGSFAAIADEANPDTLILYRDIALEPGRSHFLSLLAYYDSYKPIAIPSPDTLSVDFETLNGQKNQQFRIDVMRPEAPLESIAPGDVLLTLFQTKQGGPVRMEPTRLTADLSAFAGQTVRLRVAVAAHEEVLNAGVDDVAITANPPSQSGRGSNPRGGQRFSVGRARPNRHNGSVVLPVAVQGPGLLSAKAKRRKSLQPANAKARAAGTVRLRLKPTSSALATLRRRHRLKLEVTVSFKPSGESREAVTVPVVLELAS